MQINLAYEVLSDPEKKANYDKFGNTNQNNYFKDNLFQGFKDFLHRAHNCFEDFLKSGEKTEESINKKFVFLMIDHLVKKILIF